jgi:general stress protein 26
MEAHMSGEHGSTDRNDIARVWRLMDDIDVCMLASRDGERIRARPMAAIPRRDAHAIYFLSSIEGHKDQEIAEDDHVCLTFARPGDGKFLVVTGRARVRNDRALIRELWNDRVAAWWEGPDDPRVRVIEVTPEDAQFWEGPHGIAGTIAMVTAAATAGPPALGDQRKVDLQ